MKRPTRVQVFYAQDWPIKIWFTAILVLCALLPIFACGPTVAEISNWRFLLWFVAVTLISLLLGFLGAGVVGWLIFGPLYYIRGIKNGGPFKPGDAVQILSGPHRGKIVRVRSNWQGDSVRVDLGREAAEKFKDIFSPAELLREDGVESSTLP